MFDQVLERPILIDLKGLPLCSLQGSSPLAIARVAQAFGYLPLAYDQDIVNLFFVHESVVGRMVPRTAVTHPPGGASRSSTDQASPTPEASDQSESSEYQSNISINRHHRRSLGDLIDAQFNIVSAARTVMDATHREGWRLHSPCTGRSWVYIPREADFTLPEARFREKEFRTVMLSGVEVGGVG